MSPWEYRARHPEAGAGFGRVVDVGEGDVYSEEEARGWLRERGRRPVDRQGLAGQWSLMVAETADAP